MRILFFSQLKDVTGKSEIEWSLDQPLNPDEFWARLLELYPALRPYRDFVRLARNLEYVPGAETLLGNEDEVALIPPVSGG